MCLCNVEGYTAEKNGGKPMLAVQLKRQITSMLDTLPEPKLTVVFDLVQFLAERYPHKPVFPAVNSVFVGINRDIGWYEENCKCCGDCVLGMTGGICPVARCAKSLFNGPCGGSKGGYCEVGQDTFCAWTQIVARLKKLNKLHLYENICTPKNWKPGGATGPRKRVRTGLEAGLKKLNDGEPFRGSGVRGSKVSGVRL